MENKENNIYKLNIGYSKKLAKWAGLSENLNDDVLLKMLTNLIKEYDTKSLLFLDDLKFKTGLLKKKKKIFEKEEKLNLSNEIKQSKFRLKKQKKLNKRLFRMFKKKTNFDLNNEFLAKNKEFQQYLNENKIFNIKKNKDLSLNDNDKIIVEQHLSEDENLDSK